MVMVTRVRVTTPPAQQEACATDDPSVTARVSESGVVDSATAAAGSLLLPADEVGEPSVHPC